MKLVLSLLVVLMLCGCSDGKSHKERAVLYPEGTIMVHKMTGEKLLVLRAYEFDGTYKCRTWTQLNGYDWEIFKANELEVANP